MMYREHLTVCRQMYEERLEGKAKLNCGLEPRMMKVD
jgi:hypothetical protein